MSGEKLLAQNKKAWHDYFIDEKYEAGIELVGTEVKSCRMAKVNLRDSYVQVRGGEAFVNKLHISPYEKGNIFNRDPLRVRKLLLHKREIEKLLGLSAQRGLTLIPLKMYLKRGKVKLEVGVCRGKHLYDKRQDLKEKAIKRDMERRM
ncbi:MAG: SsrA-binding protein SmpB [Christensenella sp.]|uniref:SsrA-binding protein SmpB n=1 Tax=Christensenella sp. TaxID=1935934 RepID=UPI002B1F39F1|nr:SsrA-binding protein SmpB [Christensenella sp.]MEA5003810.1 SsrA-binding protein SmpB [Christensenella sp.]